MTIVGRAARVRELFDMAVRLDPDARHRMLEETCGTDTDLKNELMELLALDACEEPAESGAFIGGRRGAEWLAAEISESLPATDHAPAMIGPYTIERELGRGGMGIVYAASQREPSRRVAIKVMHPGVLGRSGTRRFRRELQALAQLRHPGIVQVLDAGSEAWTDSTSRPYMVMELVDGRSLRDYIREDAPSITERLTLLATICDAVNHAHQHGIVHRDLTPDNIMVQNAEPPLTGSSTLPILDVQPKILDFGVCRLLDTEPGETIQTIAGQIVGTVPYLSPEQAQGNPIMTDIRSDVYSLGVIAFEVLTGRRPYETDRLTTAAALRVVLTTSPARLGNFDRALRGDIETMVHKAMERDAADRYQSAADFAGDLRRYLNTEPILARTPSLLYVTNRFVRRNRGLSAAIAGSLFMLVACLAIVTMFWSQARETREASLWQTYVASLGAASASIAEGDVAAARRQLSATPEKHRGWEYRHFASRLDQSNRVIKPALPAPMTPPFSLVAGASPNELMLVSNSAIAVLPLDGTAQATPALDPDLCVWLGAQASRFPEVVEVKDRSITYIDATTRQRKTLSPAGSPFEPERISRARLSADGNMLVCFLLGQAGSRVAVCAFNLATGELRTVYESDGRYPQGLALSPDGTHVAFSLSERNQLSSIIRVAQTATGTTICETEMLPSRPAAMIFDHSGNRLYANFIDGTLDAWSLSNGSLTLSRRRAEGYDPSLSLCISPDGSMLAAGSRDRPLRIFDAHTLEVRHEFLGHDAEVQDARFTPDSRTLWSVDAEGVIRSWDLRSPPDGPAERPMVLRGHTDLVHPLAISESRKQLVTGGWDRTISIFSLEDGTRLTQVSVPNLVIDLAMSPDERFVVSREFEGSVRIWDAATLAPICEIPHRTVGIDQALFSRDSTRFVLDILRDEGALLIAESATGKISREPISALEHVEGPTVDHATGVFVYVGQIDDTYRLQFHSYRTNDVLFAEPARRTAVEAFAFSTDRSSFAVQGLDNRIRIYDARTYRLLQTLTGHTREVLDTVFSPDGSRLFSADVTGVIRIWDTQSGDELAQLRGHTAHIRRLAISRDGSTLISGSRDGTARVWVSPLPDMQPDS